MKWLFLSFSKVLEFVRTIPEIDLSSFFSLLVILFTFLALYVWNKTTKRYDGFLVNFLLFWLFFVPIWMVVRIIERWEWLDFLFKERDFLNQFSLNTLSLIITIPIVAIWSGLSEKKGLLIDLLRFVGVFTLSWVLTTGINYVDFYKPLFTYVEKEDVVKPQIVYRTNKNPNFLRIGDFNGDNLDDVVVASNKDPIENYYKTLDFFIQDKKKFKHIEYNIKFPFYHLDSEKTVNNRETKIFLLCEDGIHIVSYGKVMKSRLLYPFHFGKLGGIGNGILIDDLNNDGRDDIIVCYHEGIKILFMERLGVYQLYEYKLPRLEKNELWQISRPTIGDIDNDGKKDIIWGKLIFLSRLDFQSKFTLVQKRYNIEPGNSYLAIGDIDNDGLNDVVATHFLGGSLYVYRQEKNDKFLEPLEVKSPDEGRWRYRRVKIDDIDNDGLNDIITCCEQGSLLRSDRANSIAIYLHQKKGNFLKSIPIIHYGGYGLGDVEGDVAIWDVNNDGKKDIILSNPYSHTISIFINAT